MKNAPRLYFHFGEEKAAKPDERYAELAAGKIRAGFSRLQAGQNPRNSGQLPHGNRACPGVEWAMKTILAPIDFSAISDLVVEHAAAKLPTFWLRDRALGPQRLRA